MRLVEQCLAALERVKGLVSVADEGEGHLSLLFLGHGASLGAEEGAVIFLGNLIDGEVGDVNVGSEPRFEGGADSAQLLPYNATEEGMIFNLSGTTVLASFLTNAVFRVTKEAISSLA